MSEYLTVRPTDLTRLVDDEGDEFPAERVARAIDGRQEVVLHGKREMPIWGLSFQDSGRDSGQEAEVRTKIRDLIEYLRSVQKTGSN